MWRRTCSAGTAEHELAQARMAVAAHHQQIGALVLRLQQERLADVGVRSHGLGRLALDAMAGQRRQCRRRHVADHVALALRVDPGDLDLPGATQQRQGVERRARRLAATIPSHQHLAEKAPRLPAFGTISTGRPLPTARRSAMSRWAVPAHLGSAWDATMRSTACACSRAMSATLLLPASTSSHSVTSPRSRPPPRTRLSCRGLRGDRSGSARR